MHGVRFVDRLLRRKPVRPALAIVPGVTRAGTVGVAIYRQGQLVAWGRTESAAWASFQVSAA